jgi:hypothetical protein
MVAVCYRLQSGDLHWLAEPTDGWETPEVGAAASPHSSGTHASTHADVGPHAPAHAATGDDVEGVVFDAPAAAAPPGGAGAATHDAAHTGSEPRADPAADDGHGPTADDAIEAGTTDPSADQAARRDSRSLVSTILLGFMVATSGVGILILLQRRRLA